MNVSFSTRGWQQIPWEQQVQMAETMRFGGVELYNVHKTPELTGRGGPLHRYTAAATARELWQKGLCIPCFDTACDIAGEDCTETVTALMQLAHDVQCPYVSVTAQRDDDARISAALEALLPAAEAQGITILLKTSGVFSDTARLRTLLDAFACDQLGALWDMHHPYRDHGESADTTIKNLGAYVRHVHLRDSDDDGSYDLIGEGTLPVGSMMQALSSIDYDGFISLEWKPEWMPDLTDPEVIFPHFVNYMHRFDSPRGKKKTLYDNAAHTGKFVWKKDSLISETFPQVLDRMVEEFPDQYAFKYTTLDYTRTYAQFRDDVDDFARALVSLGVRRGSKVAIWATNVPAWFITFWAATKIGAVLVTVNTAYKIHEAEYLLRQSDTHTLVMIDHCLDSDYKTIIQTLCPELAQTKPGQPLHSRKLPFLRNVITVGFQMPGCLTFDAAMDRAELTPQGEIARMAAQLARLPGIGQKSAQRLAYHIAGMPEQDVHDLAAAIWQGRKAVRFCAVCGNYTQNEICDICADEARQNGQICVVRDPRDVAAMERMRDYHGRYHELHGALSPMNGIGPEDIHIRELLARLSTEKVDEVILATNPDIEGEATAAYIARLIKPMGVRVTRIAHGVPVGSDLEYADEITLSKAMEGRREL